MRRLKKAGIDRNDVTIVVALGTHRRMTEAEMRIKYGERVVEDYRIINHEYDNESELASFGVIMPYRRFCSSVNLIFDFPYGISIRITNTTREPREP